MFSVYKTLVQPHVEYCSCAWNPSYKKDKELLEKIQYRYTKMIIIMREKTWRKVKVFRVTDIREASK